MVQPMQSWFPGDFDFIMRTGEVQIWCVWLNRLISEIPQLTKHLSYSERFKINRYRFDRDKRYSTISRGVLRVLLGHYLDVAPGSVCLNYGPNGKPSLDPDHHPSGLRFNLAHSRDISLYAFVDDSEIGIDLEYIRQLPDAEKIAERTFSRREYLDLTSLPINQRTQAFYNCWTRKEAYIKALGYGLSLPTNQYAVSMAPGEPARLLHVEGKPDEIARWTLRSWTPAPGYVAALAVDRASFEVVRHQVPLNE
jgi:4'-phosphopantetheinyl transferase